MKMNMYPKEGTLEALVLAKLLTGKEITLDDFEDYPEVTAESLDQAVQNLMSGMFESEVDNKLAFDA